MSSLEDDAIEWLKARGDIVERDCASTVCALIPLYALLWANFIGNDNGQAKSYPLLGLELLKADERAKAEKDFEKFGAAHYTLFNHVYSANSKIKKAQEIQARPRDGLVHAAFLENLEEFYFHYGVILTQFERAWAVVLKKDPDSRGLRTEIQNELSNIFGENSDELKQFKLIKEILEVTRHDVEHYSRSATYYDKESEQYFVKTPRKKGEAWSENQGRTGQYQPAIEVLKEDFESIIKLLNLSYPKLMATLASFLSSLALKTSAADQFLVFQQQKATYFSEYGEPSCSAVIVTSSNCVSGQSRPLGTATAVYPPADNASGDGIKK